MSPRRSWKLAFVSDFWELCPQTLPLDPAGDIRPQEPRVGFGAHVCYHCRISPPRFLAECSKRRLNQGSLFLLFLGCLLCLICI